MTTTAVPDPWTPPAGFRASPTAPLTGLFRAFTGMPNYIPDYPITMNGCSLALHRTRWRSIGTPVTVGKVFFSDAPERATRSDATQLGTAMAGSIDAGSCEQPIFCVTDAGPSTLTDITYEVREYEPAP